MKWLFTEPLGSPELMLAHWWAESGSRRLWGCCPLTGGWSQVLGLVLDCSQTAPGPGVWLPRDPRAGVRSLAGGAGSWQSWIWGVGCPEACVGPIMGRAGVLLVSEQSLACCGQAGPAGCWIVIFLHLVPAPWLVRLLQRLEQAFWKAAGWGSRFWSWCLSTGGWIWVLGSLVGRAIFEACLEVLWAQEVFRQSVCWWVRLCPHPVAWPEVSHHWSYRLFWGTQVSVLMSGVGFHNGTHEHKHSWGRRGPRCELQLPPTSLGDSPRSADRSGPGFYQITAFTLGPRTCEILCAPFHGEVSISPSPVGLPKLCPAGLQSQILWGLVFLV